MKYIFFGTPQFAVTILEELKGYGFLPSLIVSAPDMPSGRKLVLTPSPVSLWAVANNIQVLKPTKLSEQSFVEKLRLIQADISIVAAYGKIIPEVVLNIPTKGTLNVHPSLLPLLRGASPIESAVLAGETETGVSIMLLDKEMDHGPIIAQEKYPSTWQIENPPLGSILEHALAEQGGKLLSSIIPKWISGKIEAVPQDHSRATFCGKIKKENGLIELSDDPLLSIRKIRAFDTWPGAFFFMEIGGRNLRIRITRAHIEDKVLVIERVIPEGKNEMNFEDFKRGIRAV